MLNLTQGAEICLRTDKSFQKSLQKFQELLKTESCTSTIKKLQTSNTLNLSKKGISDISILQYATNLKVLLLSQNQISDISPLSNIKIRWLDVSKNQLSDISPISGIETLETLWASHMNIEDITALRSLTKLRYVSLEDNKIKNIDVLSELTYIEFLGLSQNEIEDFRVFEKHKNIFVSVKGNPIVHCPKKGRWINLCLEERDQ